MEDEEEARTRKRKRKQRRQWLAAAAVTAAAVAKAAAAEAATNRVPRVVNGFVVKIPFHQFLSGLLLVRCRDLFAEHRCKSL